MPFMTVRAYGKINLSLAITGRRPDGFHTISSVMQSVSLYNTVKLKDNAFGKITLQSDDPALPTDERNTAFRAAAAFLKAAQLPDDTGLSINIEKRVPYQAGMGSASADAAGTLIAANRLFDEPLSANQLMEVGTSVGADVPFCMTGGTCLAEGIGERLTPLPDMPRCYILLAHPNAGISTPQAYERFDRLTDPVQPDTAAMVAAVRAGSLSNIAKSCGNVFELCCEVEAVNEIKERMKKSGALTACMTGSGTAVFGLFADADMAKAAREAMVADGWRCWLTEPVGCGVGIE